MNDRIFYVEADTDLAELSALLRSAKADTVVFVLPRQAMLFESIVNLQILRQNAEEVQKNLVLITSAAKGRTLSETAGIEAHSTLESWEKKLPTEHEGIAARKNPISETTTPKIRKIRITAEAETNRSQKEVEPEPYSWREILTRPSWQALAILLIFTLGLFAFLSVLAFPGATISITPDRKGLETITNVELVRTAEGAAVPNGKIAAIPIETVFSRQIEFNTITKRFEGANASGQITIMNSFNEERQLVPTTRFQTESGLVFRSAEWVSVPAATRGTDGKMVPGSAVITVTADEQDVNGEFVGERGNIEPTRFFLPALNEAARTGVWGESTTAFSGGITAWRPEVTEEDLQAARTKIEAELLAAVDIDLQKFLDEKNRREQHDYSFFPGAQFLEKTVQEVTLPENILGTNAASFLVSGTVKVRTWVYSKAELHALLRAELATKTDPKMRLTDIAFDENTAELMERDERAGTMKLTITARGAEEFLIDPRSEAGIRFVNEIKAEIIGLPRSDAEAIIANNPAVAAVEISLWPFWNRKLPNLPENIAVKLKAESAE